MNNAMTRTIIVTEDQARQVGRIAEMWEDKFIGLLRAFLRDLLVDPVHAKPREPLLLHGLTRRKLLRLLMQNHIVESSQKIVDEDADGNPCTAVMRVKYRVPREDFDRKAHKLWIQLFETNTPHDAIAEDMGGGTGCEASAGAYSAPIGGGVQRRAIYHDADEVTESTTLSTVGDIQYAAPMSTKSKSDPTLKRGQGVNGSTSVEIMTDNNTD